MLWFSHGWLALLIDVSAKSLLLALLAGGVLAALRVRNANVKHCVWMAILVAMFVLPLLVWVTPTCPLPLHVIGIRVFVADETQATRVSSGALAAARSAEAAISPSNHLGEAPRRSNAAGTEASLPDRPTEKALDDNRRGVATRSQPARPAPDNGEVASKATHAPSVAAWGLPRRHWPMVVFAVYVLVFGLFVLRLVVATLRVRIAVRGSIPISSRSLGISFEEAMCRVASRWGLPGDAAAGVRLVGRVALIESPRVRVPLAVGWWWPKILLPQQWRSWSDEKRLSVLIHELTHVDRRDWSLTLLAEANRCFYWFHPLAWFLCRQLPKLAEQSCDDAVVGLTGDRPGYARHLLEIAGEIAGRRGRLAASTGIPMAHRSNVERRIEAILDGTRPLARRLSRRGTAVLIGLVVPAVFLAAAIRPAAGRTSGETHPLAEAAVPLKAEATRAGDPAKNGVDSIIGAAERGATEVDLRFVSPDASIVFIMRPAEVLARADLARWMGLRNWCPRSLSEKWRLVEFRQITIMIPPDGDFQDSDPDLVVFQSVKPLSAARTLAEEVPGLAITELKGRTLYAFKMWGGSYCLQYDEHTIVWARSEHRMLAYLEGKRGALPTWFPAKAWDDFRDDHAMFACDMRVCRRPWQQSLDEGPDDQRSLLAAISPIWEDTECMIVGLRAGEVVRMHTSVVVQDEEGAKTVVKTVEAARLLALNILKAQAESARERGTVVPLLALDPLLKSTRIDREGQVVRAHGSIGLDSVLNALPAPTPEARAAAEPTDLATQTCRNLKWLALALRRYEMVHGRFPPAVLQGPGQQPFSRRVAILPYLDEKPLYDQYDFDKPWNSPANRKVLEQMPRVFRSPIKPAGSVNTCYFALVGPGTMFEGNRGIKVADVTDGLRHTTLLVDAKRDIPWTKPEDIPYSPDSPLPQLGDIVGGVFAIAHVDGCASTWLLTTPADLVRGMITRNGRDLSAIAKAEEEQQPKPDQVLDFPPGTEPFP